MREGMYVRFFITAAGFDPDTKEKLMNDVFDKVTGGYTLWKKIISFSNDEVYIIIEDKKGKPFAFEKNEKYMEFSEYEPVRCPLCETGNMEYLPIAEGSDKVHRWVCTECPAILYEGHCAPQEEKTLYEYAILDKKDAEDLERKINIEKENSQPMEC